MKRMFSGLQRRVTSPLSASDSPSPTSPGNDTPESIIAREIKAFCESGSNGNGSSSAANDYIHLPAIVDAAESSANAAKEAVVRIRKYLSNPSKVSGSTQYNSVMLIRILSENPGHTFTRNFDTKFVTTVKELLREGRDISAQQMLRETLDMFETQKSWDEGLAELIKMWKRKKQRIGISTPPPMHPQYAQRAGPYAPSPRRNQLPPPNELASRISEARTSANLLIQLAQSTPATEVPSHELMREFCQRCEAAHRSIQGYMAVENPPPDENTMLTLIETNEQLSVALSKYQRTLLNARKALGTSTPPPNTNGHQQPNTRDSSPAINGQENGNSGGAKSGILIAELEAENSSSADANSSRASPAQRNTFASLSGPFSFDTSFETSSLSNTTTTAAAAKSRSDSSLKPTAASDAAIPSKRYDYNPDEFNVENPFADNAGGDNLDHGFDRGNNDDIDHQQKPSRREV